MTASERSLSRARGLFLLCAAVAMLGAVAAMSFYNLLGPILHVHRPHGFSLLNLLALYMDHAGVAALFSVALCLALATGGWEKDGAPPGRMVATCLEVLAWTVLAVLALRILCIAGHTDEWSRHVRTVARVLELAAVGGVAACIIAGVGWKRMLLSPRWSWLLATLISTVPPMVLNAVDTGSGEPICFWFRICIYPLCFATCWSIWEEEQEASQGGSHAALLGVIIWLPTSMFLTYENYLGDHLLGDLKAAYILTLIAVGLNAAGMLAPAILRLVRGQGSRLVLINLALGLFLLTLATFPAIVPPWEYESRGFLNRVAIQTSQALVGTLLILLTRFTLLLRRWDPRGEAWRLANLVWLLLSVGYLLTALYRDWAWSYEVWVTKQQWVHTVHLRRGLAAAWVPAFLLALLALMPSVMRAVRSFFMPGAGDPRS